MDLINSLIEHLKKTSELKKGETPAGYCPNCWGTQEYGKKFYEVAKNYKVDINSSNPNLGWVQEYANKYLAGIVLKSKDDKIVCQGCKLIYRPEKEEK